MSPKLPFIPVAQPGESPLSLLRRTSIGNGYHRLLALIHSLLPEIDHSKGMLGFIACNPGIYNKICHQLGIRDQCRESVHYERVGTAREDQVLWQGLQVNLGDLEFKTEKICIPCYLEKGYTLSQWNHVVSSCCPEHDVLLETACPKCLTPFHAEKKPLACRCEEHEILRLVQPVQHDYASVMQDIITRKDQDKLTCITRLYKMLLWWETIGLPFTPLRKVEALYQLFQGKWPEFSHSNQVQQIHFRVLLSPLLTTSSAEIEHKFQQLIEKAPKNIRFTAFNNEQVDKKTTCALLGISRFRFQKFEQEGLIRSLESRRYSLEQINQLLLSSRWLPLNEQELYQWQSADKGRYRLSLAKLVKTELKRNNKNLIKPLENIDSSSHLTIQEISKRLRTNSESIRFLVNQGLLKATKGSPKSVVQWIISPRNLEEFTETYIFASAVAKNLGIHPYKLIGLLRTQDISPISGPSIDSGKTYLLLKKEIDRIDLKEIIQTPSQTLRKTGGRREKPRKEYLSSRELAKCLKIPITQIRYIIKNQWIKGIKDVKGNYLFEKVDVEDLMKNLQENFLDLNFACSTMNQTTASFRRTWLISGYIPEYQFGKKALISRIDLDRISHIWAKYQTSTHIAASIGRERSFCLNLEKMGLLEPEKIIGQNFSKIKLFPKEHPLYTCYKKQGL